MSESVVFLTSVVVLGILAQWLAWRLRLPSILLLLVFGFAAGRFSGIDTETVISEPTLFAIVSLSVAVILFEGGLSLQFHELREAGSVVLRLVTVGVLVAWLLTSASAWLLLEMDPRVAALVGAILVVTGPTVIAPLLRHVKPAKRVGSIVKWEGIVIDPIGAILAVLVYEALISGGSLAGTSQALSAANIKLVGWILLKTAVIGISIAAIATLLLVQLVRRFLIPDFLSNSVFLAVALGVFTLSISLFRESGLVTVTLLGVMLANQKQVPVRHVVEFKENLRVLLISCLFIVLSSRIRLSDLYVLVSGGALFLACLIFVIRPLSVLAATWGTELSWRERCFLSFLAPRGIVAAAVSSVFALEVSHITGQGSPLSGTDQIVPLTFLVIVGTVAVYGMMAGPLARWLKLAVPSPQGVLLVGAAPWTRSVAESLQAEGIEVLLVDTNYGNIAAAKMAGLPAHCASILSEYMEEETDLSNIGRLLALTPNDDLNSLAAMEFAQLFGRAEVYQLTPGDTRPSRRITSGGHIRGRYLFSAGATYAELASRAARGAQIKRTKITEEFTIHDFRQMYGDLATVLFVKNENGDLVICTDDSSVEPKAGQTVIALVDPADC